MNKRVNLDSPELADNLRSNSESGGIVQRRQPRRTFNAAENTEPKVRTSLDVALDEVDPVPEDLVEEPETTPEPEVPKPEEEAAPEPTVSHLASDAEEAVVQPNFKNGIVPNTKQGWMITGIVLASLMVMIFSLALLRNSDAPITPVLSATDINSELNIIAGLEHPVDNPTVTATNASEFEVAPTLDTYTNYRTQINSPRLLQIEKLGIAAIVESTQTNSGGNIVLPENSYNVGWLKESNDLNDSNGVILIVGHASGYESDGLFSKLHTLSIGDKIVVESGKGVKTQFRVVENLFHEYGEEDMFNAQIPHSLDSLSLNLLSCDCRSDVPDDEKQRSVLIRTEMVEQ